MLRNILYMAIAIAALGVCADVAAKEPKTGHKFKGSIGVQNRTNDNIGIAPGSGEGFDFADITEFGSDDDGDGIDDEEEDEDDDDFDDPFDDLVDAELDDEDIEEDDAVDEDGDGIDDLIDPNADIEIDKERRFTIKAGLGHKYAFANGTTAWTNGLKIASDTHADRSDLDKFNFAVTTGFEFSPKGSKHKWKPSLSYVTLEKDDSKFVSTLVASLAYEYELSKRVSLSATYNYQDKDITKDTSPDARIDTLALGADFKITDDDILKIEYAPKFEDSTQVTRNTDAWGYEIAYTRKLPWEMTAGLGYKFDSVDHKNLTPRREDDSDTWGVELTRAFGKKLTFGIGYETKDRSSNIPNKDAQNDSFYLEGEYKF